jgi:phage terminase large subunit GpA-like protein
MFYLAKDNGVLCPKCANAYTPDRDNDEQLQPVAYDVNWEDNELFCEHCNARIESAYGEVQS